LPPVVRLALAAFATAPCTRIYCVYDDDAIDGSDANEDALGYDPLKGDWHVSLPSQSDDLAWVQTALKKHSACITARDADDAVTTDESAAAAKAQTLTLDPKGFLGS